MPKKKSNTIEKNLNFNTTTTDDEEEKNFKRKAAFLSNTYQNFSSNRQKPPELSYFNNFQGFFNKKFNLTSFKQKKEDSRSRSKSPERIINPHKLKGNGIPNDIVERTKFLGKIFDSPKFKKFYKINVLSKKKVTFDEISEKIFKFMKKNTQLEGIMMIYYFICHYINYDYNFLERNEDYKKSQSIERVLKFKRALSLGFTNLFENIMKKLEIKCKHIEGYCKLLPDRVKYMTYNNSQMNTDNNNNNSNIFSNNNLNTSINNTKEKFNNKNSSIVFSMFNNSSIINSKTFGASKTLTTLNLYSDLENQNDLSNYTNHCWNAFYYKGEWYFIDTVLGSCSFDKEKVKSNITINDNDNNDMIYNNNEENKNFSNFNPFFFMPPAEYLINSHLPANDSWQMTKKFCSLKQFLIKRSIDYGKFYKGLFRYDVKLLSHQNPFIQINKNENLVIRIKVLQHVLEAHLYDSTGLHKINEVKYFVDSKNGIFSLEPSFPKIGEFLIRINIRPVYSTDIVYKPLFDYLVRVTNNLSFNHFEKYKKIQQARNEGDKMEENILLPKIQGFNQNKLNKPSMTFSQGRIITDYNKIFPSKTNKVICYDNEGFVLFEPKTIYLKKGKNTNFKIKIKGAHSVLLLDGNKWTPLKKTEENIFEGQKEIKSENVSICCLKNKNVFTEVFRFKIKKKIYFSKSFGMTHRRIRNKTNNTINNNQDTDNNMNNINRVNNSENV